MRRPTTRTTTSLRGSQAAPITGVLFQQAARFELWMRQFDPLQIFAAVVLVGLMAYVVWQNCQSGRAQQQPIIIVATERPGYTDLANKVVAPLGSGAALRPSSTPATAEQPAAVVIERQPIYIIQQAPETVATVAPIERPTALPAVTDTPTMIVPKPPFRPKPLQPPVTHDQPIADPAYQPTQAPEPTGTN